MNPFLDIIFNGKWTPSTENTEHTLREFASLGNGCPAGVTLGLQVKVRFYSQDVNPDNSNRTWVSHSHPPRLSFLASRVGVDSITHPQALVGAYKAL